MIRLLIADDEKIIRETICNIIDWKSLGIEVVAVCKNGLEAYDAILDEYPDIVLTDIRMPKLSGLELIQKITQNHDHIQFIILSGYEDFEYAREAMRYGIRHYLLKPCNEKEIIEAVLDAIEEHNRQAARHSGQSHILPSYNPAEGNLYYHIFLRALPDEENLEDLPALFGSQIDFYHTEYRLFFLYYLEETYVDDCISCIDGLMKQNKIQSRFTYIYVKNTLIFFMESAQTDMKQMDQILSSVNFGSHQGNRDCQNIDCPDFLTLLRILCEKVKRYDTIMIRSKDQATTINNYASLYHQISSYTDRLAEADTEDERIRCIEEINKILSSVKNTELLQSLAVNIFMKSVQSSYSVSAIADFISFISSIHSNTEICSFLSDRLNTLFVRQKEGSDKYKPFIRDIMNYTQEHISDPNLTLKWIVETQLYMNVDYVSRQFLLQTGTKFSNYLNGLRIEKAKQLLLHCENEKIYSVAEQVGCGNNPQYFSHLFKKYTNMTPKQYIQEMSANKN